MKVLFEHEIDWSMFYFSICPGWPLRTPLRTRIMMDQSLITGRGGGVQNGRDGGGGGASHPLPLKRAGGIIYQKKKGGGGRAQQVLR